MVSGDEVWVTRPTVPCAVSRRLVDAAVSEAAAAIGMAPDEFYAAIEADPAAVASFAGSPGMALIAGGLPLLAGGQVAGAIGVAGAMTGAADRRIAEAAIAAVASGVTAI
jgi:uncharacterized protein GlcG (DUF336 family)